MSDWIAILDGVCCPYDKQVIKEGDENCEHEMVRTQNNDECMHVNCKKCDREICWGVWE